MTRSHRLAALAVAAALGGCTSLGPDHPDLTRAAVQNPSAKGAFLGAAPISSYAPLGPWWRLYQDPTLDALETEALAANTDLRAAAATLAQTQALLVQTRSAQAPHASASAAYERAQDSGESYLLPVQLPAQTLADVGFSVSYQLDLFGRLKRASEAAADDVEASQAGYDLARITVAANVAAAYMDACAANEELQAAERLIAVQTRSVEVAQRLARGGRGSPMEVARARAQLDQLEATPPSLLARRQGALMRLALLTGKAPADYPKSAALCRTPPRLARPLPVGDGASLLQRRPDVRQAERRLAASTARIGVAAAALYPNVALGLGAGSTGLAADLGHDAANHWALGSLISWNFPDAGARARVRQAKSGAEADLARFDGVVLNALRETETLLDAYAKDLERRQALSAQAKDTALAAEDTRRLVQGGRSPLAQGLDADRTLASAELSLAAADGQIAADQVRLFLALGGGWER